MEQIDGVADIQTDPNALTASFKLTKGGVDYKALLAKYAESNSHLAGYEIESVEAIQ